MSSGIMVCSACRMEIHQNGPKEPGTNRTTWTHCCGSVMTPGTPICEGATPDYPSSEEPRGKWCGADACAGF